MHRVAAEVPQEVGMLLALADDHSPPGGLLQAKIDTDCVIAGGGPAGIMAGLLFARAGVPTWRIPGIAQSCEPPADGASMLTSSRDRSIRV